MIKRHEVMPKFPMIIDKSTGDLLWSKDYGKSKAGEVAGKYYGGRYAQIYYKGKVYRKHRVVFWVANGWLPDFIDHIDGDPSNNRPDNLRPATFSENTRNRDTQKNNRIGFRGVRFDPSATAWMARIQVDGKSIYLGSHQSLLDAVSARLGAERKYHGEFVRPRSGGQT